MTDIPRVRATHVAQFNVALRMYRHCRRRAMERCGLVLETDQWRWLNATVADGCWPQVDDVDPNDPLVTFWRVRLHGRTVTVAYCEAAQAVVTVLSPASRTAHRPVIGEAAA